VAAVPAPTSSSESGRWPTVFDVFKGVATIKG
jgi:hypothetical protein